MTDTPSAAIRVTASDDGYWMLAGSPFAAWSAPDAAAIMRSQLADAIKALQTHPEGLLVGLLPYPCMSQNASDATPAHLLLYSEYRKTPTLDLPTDGTFRLTADFTPDTSREQYLTAVRQVQAYLAAGDAYQVNLAQRFSARYEGNPWHAFARTANHFQAPCTAWLDLGDRAILSFSPESFLTVHGQEVETKPIKGTRPRGNTIASDDALADDLARHPKDRAENLMIVDLLRNDLGRVCVPGTVRVPTIFAVESFRNVHHLVSAVTGTLTADKSIVDLLSACFPGGSITGAPKKRAMEIIEELERVPRDVYCGSVFWLTADGRFGSNILIRTFLAHAGTLHGWAGAGIVADSIPESEHQECLDKIQQLMKSLGS